MEEKKEEGKKEHHMIGSRRFMIALISILSCLILGLYLRDVSVASSIAIISVGIAGANALESLKKP